MKKIFLAILFVVAVAILSGKSSFVANANETNPYTEIFDSMTEDEYLLLGQLVYHEARGENAEGQQAVVEVVLNRVLSAEYPCTVAEVIKQRGAFSTRKQLSGTIPMQAQIDNIEYVRANGVVSLDTRYVYFSTRKQRYGKDYVKIDHQWFGR